MTRRLLIAVTRPLPPACEDRIKAKYDLRAGDDATAYTAIMLADHARDADALLVTPVDHVSADAIARLPESVKIISTYSAGYDHIDLAAARKRNMRVTFAPGTTTEATADIALLLILGASRRATEAIAMLYDGSWRGVRPTVLLGHQITGRNLGIVGMGRIGAALARRAQACGMNVFYHNRKPAADAPQGATFVPALDELLRKSEVLSLHCPLTPETTKLLNRERIALLPDGAIVVNTARGGVIDDDALIAALQSGKVFAAGLDVYANEPALDQRYKKLPNVFALPHIGSATIETRTAIGMVAIDNIEAVFQGREPPYPVM